MSRKGSETWGTRREPGTITDAAKFDAGAIGETNDRDVVKVVRRGVGGVVEHVLPVTADVGPGLPGTNSEGSLPSKRVFHSPG